MVKHYGIANNYMHQAKEGVENIMDELYIKTNNIPSWIADEYFYGKDIVSIEEILCAMDNIKDDLEYWKEKYEDFRQDVEDNYKFIGEREAIGYDESW